MADTGSVHTETAAILQADSSRAAVNTPMQPVLEYIGEADRAVTLAHGGAAAGQTLAQATGMPASDGGNLSILSEIPFTPNLEVTDPTWETGGEAYDTQSLVMKYNIPCFVFGDHGDTYEKTDDELRKDVEVRLEEERQKAWLAAKQAELKRVDLVARSLLKAEGISTSTKSISLTNEDLMPIREGWGPSLCGMFAGRFPGKDAVLNLIQKWRVPVKVACHRKGWMVFSFANQQDMEKVWKWGPQTVFGIPLILEPMPDDLTST